MDKTVAEIRDRQEDEAWNRELERLGRYDLIKDRVGTIEEAPRHYNVGIEPGKYIQSHGLDFLQGSVIKYVTRYKLKGQAKEIVDTIRKGPEANLYEIEPGRGCLLYTSPRPRD